MTPAVSPPPLNPSEASRAGEKKSGAGCLKVGLGCGVITLIVIIVSTWGVMRWLNGWNSERFGAHVTVWLSYDLEKVSEDRKAETMTVTRKSDGIPHTVQYKDLAAGYVIERDAQGNVIGPDPHDPGNAPEWVPRFPAELEETALSRVEDPNKLEGKLAGRVRMSKADAEAFFTAKASQGYVKLVSRMESEVDGVPQVTLKYGTDLRVLELILNAVSGDETTYQTSYIQWRLGAPKE